MRKIVLFIFFQFFIFPSFAKVVINEIHYKTPEWIEIYNPSNITIYLNNWIIADGNSNDSIKNLTIYNNSYALIVDDKIGCNAFNISNNSCLEIGNIGSGLNDDGDSIYLYDNQGNLVDSVTYNSSMGANENEMSLQRINFSENKFENWIAFSPSPGKQNFYPATYFEIFSISFPERNFVNNTIKFSITILNRGIKNGTREIGFSIKANSTLYSEESLISMEAISSKTILFNWTPKLAGNYTICAKANNTLCKRFAVFQLQNASISLNITKGNKKIIFYTNLSNASCTIDYNVSVGDFLVAYGRMEKEAFRNATLDIGFGKFRVCANARINNFNDIFSYDNSVCRNITITPENKRYRIRVWLDKKEYELNETIKWAAQIFLPENKTNAFGELSVRLGKNKNSRFDYFATLYENNSFNLSENMAEIFGNFAIPSNYTKGIYKIRAKFKYSLENEYLDSSDDGIFWLNGLEDLGDLNFSVIGEKPKKAKFGEFLPIALLINSNNENGRIELRVGINKYLDENKTKYPYVRLPLYLDLERGKTYHLILPLLIDPNCNDRYKDGKYRVVLYINKKPHNLFNISISGKIGNLCQYISRSSSKPKSEKETLEIAILNLTKKVSRNSEITARVKVKANRKIDFEIYSYAYNGKKCITGSWVANRKKVSLNKGEEKIINLTNKIEEDAEPGEYTFKVRVVIDDKVRDLIDSIRVFGGEIVEKKEEKELVIARKPELKIWNDTRLKINLSNCDSCKMIIIGPNVSRITSKKYIIFENPGKYEIFVIEKGIVLNKTYFWNRKNESLEFESNNNLTEEKITGKFSEVKSNWILNFFLKIKNLFSPLIELMENSLSR